MENEEGRRDKEKERGADWWGETQGRRKEREKEDREERVLSINQP